MKRFEISPNGIEKLDIVAKVSTPESGGFVIFDGRVRNHNEGKSVTHLEYQAYDSLACKEGEIIIINSSTRDENSSAQEDFSLSADYSTYHVISFYSSCAIHKLLLKKN